MVGCTPFHSGSLGDGGSSAQQIALDGRPGRPYDPGVTTASRDAEHVVEIEYCVT
jgi:hypothetical protein